MSGASQEIKRAVWITATGAIVEHAVLPAELAAGRSEGCFQALCGQRFASAPMICPSGRRCVRCRYVVPRPTRQNSDIERADSRWREPSDPDPERTRRPHPVRSTEEQFGRLPRHRHDGLRCYLAAVVPLKIPVASPHLPPSVTPGEATGLHSRRDSDAPSAGSEFRRVPPAAGGL
jgi:hypothetical protein